jgi:sigma-B regulation protein RsbU (phosphoserine phosphatase)
LSDDVPAEDLQDLYETAPCGYVSIAPDGRIVKVNRTLTDWLGVDSEALVGKSIHDILTFGGRIAVETHLAPLLRMQGHVDELALDLLTADGRQVPAIVNAAEKRDSAGRHLFTRLTVFRAVDRRAYERNLLEARAKAEEESRAQREAVLLREQFMAVLGHDLRNPVAAIAAGIRMLERSGQVGERGQAILDQMDGSVSRVVSLINDLLDLARASVGLVADRNSDAPLGPVIEQVVGEMRAIAPEHRIEGRIEIDEPVYCDRPRLGQLTSNLLSNAVTHGSTERPIRLDAYTEGGRFILSVANAGEPIPDEVRAQLFQPFFRGATRPSRQGLGLGLFIAAEIAKAHDGAIDVVSTADETRFTFSMPATKPAA